MQRRRFLGLAAASGAFAGLGDLADLGFLARLPAVSDEQSALDPRVVRLQPDIEPLVRLLEETPRERLLEEVGLRMRRGLSYRELLAALMLAGVRTIQPRPVGFQFHAVLVVNSAHLASLASPESDRWLPIFWALDQFKVSQAADARRGDWTLGVVEESAVPPREKARQAFIDAMDRWDDAAADGAIAGVARTATREEIVELLSRYAARDFRDIGHKAIYVANSVRTLDVIGWQHAEPVLRSLALALLFRDGASGNPAESDFAADRPYRYNRETLTRVRTDWLDGRPNADAVGELLQMFRSASPQAASDASLAVLNRGVSPRSVFEACFAASAELMMRQAGILALHATTSTNAIHYLWQQCRDDRTRRLLLLQNAAFLPLFRGGGSSGGSASRGTEIDRLEPAPLAGISPGASAGASARANADAKANASASADADAIAEIFAGIGSDPLMTARKILTFLKARQDPAPLAVAARRLIFLKGTDSHDYKYSSAVFEDHTLLTPAWRDRYLAAAAFNLKGSTDPDNQLVQRTRAALS
jgi:hypothetical protein